MKKLKNQALTAKPTSLQLMSANEMTKGTLNPA